MPKSFFQGEPGFQHGEIPAVGILVVNLGTPEAPTAKAVRPYLREFLWDRRVIEISRPKWWLILNLLVLTFRPRKSAEAYASIWTEEGSPLLLYSQRIGEKMEEVLRRSVGGPLHVRLGMTYGEPSVASALAELKAKGCRRILVLPLYAHYSSTSSGAAFDAVMRELMTWRRVPEVRTVQEYHDEPGHIRALADSVRELWSREGEPERLLFSFHGIPQRYFDHGDPYHCLCHKTARLVAENLGLERERYVVSFQSLFGREEWIKPYTEMTLKAMAGSGVRSVDVVCPGFSVDCLETLEEIDEENRHYFLEAGGEQFRYIPCLNDRQDHVDFLAGLVRRNLEGWVTEPGAWDETAVRAEAEASRARAAAMAAAPPQADAGFSS